MTETPVRRPLTHACQFAGGTDLAAASTLDVTIMAGATNAFYASRLDDVLRQAGCEDLVVAGWGLEGPVHSTLRAANDRGLRVPVGFRRVDTARRDAGGRRHARWSSSPEAFSGRWPTTRRGARARSAPGSVKRMSEDKEHPMTSAGGAGTGAELVEAVALRVALSTARSHRARRP